MEVLIYKTSSVPGLLDIDVIKNNLKETDKISDPHYIMSASTAWLRLNEGSTLLDLQEFMNGLGLNTVILSQETAGKYKLCVPGNPNAELRYVADFVSNPYSVAQLPDRTPHDMEKLKYTGYSCSSRYATKSSGLNQPPKDEVMDNDIHIQLQWAATKFNVEHVIVNPDEELRKDLARSEQDGIKSELRELTALKTRKERIYAYFDACNNKYISPFGILEQTTGDQRTTSRLVIHLPTYLHEVET